MNEQRKIHVQPRLIDVRKPLRPVHVAVTRQPIKTTAPIVLGAGAGAVESVRKPNAR